VACKPDPDQRLDNVDGYCVEGRHAESVEVDPTSLRGEPAVAGEVATGPAGVKTAAGGEQNAERWRWPPGDGYASRMTATSSEIALV
jgi:hypothetical protein